jgi:diaminohydroxyphosphoribosylaminopyrimidine deaminase / 5-amino-6-(5-phosphoribosylamino)uracil reductase
MDDDALMGRALELARQGWGLTAPNPMVGAVVVNGSDIVGEGFHARYGGPHAEVAALRAAGERARDARLVVSLEPCAHFGKTPPCVDAVIAAGITHVVTATRDPGAIARGGIERLRAAAIAVDVGVGRAPAVELNAPFFHAHGSDRPWITLKLALSADGAIADASRRRRQLSGPASQRHVHHLRAGSDAVAVGVETVCADDPSLTVRDVPPPRVPPRRIIFDSTLRIPLDAAVVRTANEVPTFVVARHPDRERLERLTTAGVRVLVAPDLRSALVDLRSAGIRSLLVEGGARLAGSFLAASLVDRLIIFQTPIVLGEGALQAFAFTPHEVTARIEQAPILERREFGGDVMTVHALQPVACSPD